jgi:hypothetical protein
MARVFGENALCYVDGAAVPLANEWSIDIEQEKIESPKTFVCPPSAGSSWVTKSGGYYSASGSISALYDAAETGIFDDVLGDAAVPVLLYPDCATSTKYWMGDAWVQLSMGVPVDGYVTVDYDWESDGQWRWETA